MANHVDGPGLLGGSEHLFALLQVEAERFFAKDMLAVLEGGDGDFRVRIGRRGDIHDVNERRFDDFAPIGGGMLPAQLDAGAVEVRVVTAANGVQLDVALEGEEAGCLPPSI